MWFMYVLSWIAFILIAICLTISVAAGMYYLAELIEEYTTVAKRIIHLLLIIVTCLNILLVIFESEFTWTLSAIGLISNIIYFFILAEFPVIGFLSPTFSLLNASISHSSLFRIFIFQSSLLSLSGNSRLFHHLCLVDSLLFCLVFISQ